MPELPPTEVRALVEQMLEAIRAERDAVKRELGFLGAVPWVVVTDGRRLHAEPGAYHYRFRCEMEDRLPEGKYGIPEGTRATLDAPGVLAAGEVLVHDLDAEAVDLVLRDDLGEEVPQGRLNFDSTFLLDRLAARLEAIAESGGAGTAGTGPAERWHVSRALAFIHGLADPEPPVEIERDGLTRDQCRAVGFVIGQDIAYLWGPPGTGKTRTVAHLVHELVERAERVLLAAHTNVATDTALLRVLQVGSLPPDSVVRVGYYGEELRPFGVGLDEVVDRVLRREHPDVAREIVAVCTRVASVVRRSQAALLSDRMPLARRLRIARDLMKSREPSEENTDGLAATIATLGETVRGVEVEVINRAVVVATTLTRVYTDGRLEDLRTDAMIIDEASIASKVLAFVAACSARKRAVAVGDFMQLPAIVQATQPSARAWFGEHVFNGARCDRPEVDHPLRTMLHEQWRMHPQISKVVSRMFYAGKLRDADEVVTLAHPGPAVLLLDTSRTQARTRTTASGSKHNEVHAQLVADLVRRAGKQRIAVITPYRAQVRAIRDSVRELEPEGLASGRVEVFTVHRFQGRDKDLVIFDTCEAPGTRAAFLSELHNKDAPNLVNVAMSRAKERLVLVCHARHVAESLGRQSVLYRVMAQAAAVGAEERVVGYAPDEQGVDEFLGGLC